MRATIKQVAAEAGVSTASVSRVLNDSGYVSPDVRERVVAAVAKLHYQPSAIARSLKHDRTHMIGVIVPDISNPYFMGITRGIEDTIDSHGLQLMFCSTDENPDKERRLLRLLVEKRVDAIVLATSGGGKDVVERVVNAGLPVVLIDRRIDRAEEQLPVDLVAEDNAEGACELANRLLDDGHTRIGIVTGPEHATTATERLEGALRALRARGRDGEAVIVDGGFTMEGGKQAARVFLDSETRPTAVLSLNNRMSLGLLIEFIRSGVRIPDDITIASFGEVEACQLLAAPNIYYIDQQPYEMGLATGELLLERLQAESEREPAVRLFRHPVRKL